MLINGTSERGWYVAGSSFSYLETRSVKSVSYLQNTHHTHIIQKQNCCFLNWEKITSFINSPLPLPQHT